MRIKKSSSFKCMDDAFKGRTLKASCRAIEINIGKNKSENRFGQRKNKNLLHPSGLQRNLILYIWCPSEMFCYCLSIASLKSYYLFSLYDFLTPHTLRFPDKRSVRQLLAMLFIFRCRCSISILNTHPQGRLLLTKIRHRVVNLL